MRRMKTFRTVMLMLAVTGLGLAWSVAAQEPCAPDLTAPVITLVGDNPATVECGASYMDAGATAADDCAGDLTASITVDNPVNPSTPGTYTVRYNVGDGNGNNAVEVTRAVTVADTAAPAITLLGDTPAIVECGASYTDAGATATDACAGTVPVTTTGSVNSAVPGAYTLSYNANDGRGHNATQMTRTVTVSDTTPPVITRNGSATVTVECGTSYTDAGATATDACAGARTVTTAGSVNTAVPGAYTMRYNANDGNGNSAAEVTRTVTVADTVPPVITLLGSNPVTMKLGRTYVDAGATASDMCAGARTVTTGGSVDMAVPGTYTLTYNVNDGNGSSAAQATRTVNVVDDAMSDNLVLRDETWVTNGTVRAIASTPTTTYIGGDFLRVEPFNTGSGVPIDATTGRSSGRFPKVNGQVNACCPDGAGGWYIGGLFTQVGATASNCIAHILSDGTVDTTSNLSANGDVKALALSGTTVYAGGLFSIIGGQTRIYIAALDAATGLATAWNPNANQGGVSALAVSGTTVYVGGQFSYIGGQTRNNIAALDAATGLATAWNPDSNGVVYALALSGTTVYAGGYFTTMGGQSRRYVAALDAATGLATAWNPSPNTKVYALAASGTTVYAGGEFGSIGGQTRYNIAALDAATGLATGWNPTSSNWVYALVVSGTTVYAGGKGSIGGRSGIAAINAVTGNTTSWNPQPNSTVYALAVSGTTVYAGGSFYRIGGQARSRIAAFDNATGVPTDWDPNANNTVNALTVSGTIVYAGGTFTTIGGQARNRIAALDATINTNNATTWNPDAGAAINALGASGTKVYAGGLFTTIGGKTRNYIAALDAATGLATGWDPNAGGYVNALVLSGSTVYVGGQFRWFGVQQREQIAAIDTETGLLTGWNPKAGKAGGYQAQVFSLAAYGTTVYAGGDFNTIGGQARNYIAALDTATGLATDWNPNASGGTYPWVYTLAASGTTVYAGGGFNTIGGQIRPFLAALDATTGIATDWSPNPSSTVYALGLSPTTAYAGGSFNIIGGQSQRSSLAEFISLGSPSNPGATAIGLDTITWTWKDNASDETAFQIYVDPGSPSPTTLRTTTAPNATVWQQHGLSENTQYTFQVAAVKGAAEIGRSELWTAYTLAQAVSGLVFSGVTANAVSVASTNVPGNLSSGVSGLYFSNTSTGTNSDWHQNNTPWASTGLLPNTQYTFTGKSCNGYGLQTAPYTATKYTLAATPVAPLVYVLNLHSAGVDSLDVAVGAGDGNPLTTNYAIQVSPSVGGNTWVQADGTVGANPVFRLAATWDARRVTGLAKGTAYTFKCVARNGENVDTAPGPGTTASTYANVPPSTPVVVFPSVQSDSANLLCSISSAAYDPDGDPVRYEFDWYVKRAGQGGFVLYADGTPLPTVTSQINNTETLPGDVWHCVVTPWDNLEAGVPVQTGDCSVVLGGVLPSFIFLAASSQSVTLGQPMTALGQIAPIPAGSGTVAFHSLSPSGVASDLFPEGTVYSAGGYAKQFYPTEASEGRTAWSLTATWPGDDTYQTATSTAVTFTVLKAQPTLSLSVTPSALLAGESEVTAKATLTASLPDALTPLLANRSVKLYLRKPDGSSVGPVTATTNSNGVASFAPADFVTAGISFADPGTWQFLAEFEEDINFLHATSANYDTPEAARVTVKDSAGYAIVCVGRLDGNGEGRAEHSKTADFVYRSLRERGFAQDDIYYLREGDAQPAQDILVADTTPSKDDLRQAIEIWAQQKMNAAPGPLYLVMLNHGGENAFYIHAGHDDETRVITPVELDQWLDTMQTGLNTEASGQDLVVVVGTCHSGSFIPALSRLGRTVIASTSTKEVSHRGVKDPHDPFDVRDGEPFVTELFRAAAQGGNLRAAFVKAAENIESFTDTETNGVSSGKSPQHPLLDDNGDGDGVTREEVSTVTGQDGAHADTLVLGYGVNAAPSVGWIQAALTVGPDKPVTLWARPTRKPAALDSAWIEIKRPDFTGAVDTPDLTGFQRELPLETHQWQNLLNPDTGALMWEGLESVFDAPGAYKVYYFIRDAATHEASAYLMTTVYRRKADNLPPEAVALEYPEAGPPVPRVPTWTYFSWEESTDPDGDAITYRLEVAENDAFTNIVSVDGIVERYTQVSGLPDGATLYWRVIPVDAYGASPTDNAVRTVTFDNTNADLTTTLTGKVTNEATGLPLADASISILVDGVTYKATTSNQGTYFRGSLPQQKNYQVKAEKTNYINKTQSFWVASETAKEVSFLLRPSNLDFRWGDVNNDGKLGLTDAVMIMQWVVGPRTSFPVDGTIIRTNNCNSNSVCNCYPLCADVNADGTLQLSDALQIAHWRVGNLTRVCADTNSDGYGPDVAGGPCPTVQNKTATRTVSLQFTGDVTRGQIIRIPMVLDDATNLSDWLADVRYDDAVLSFEALENGTLTSGWDLLQANPEPGRIRIAAIQMIPITGGTGKMVTLRFTVLDTAPAGTTSVTLDSMTLNSGDFTTTTQPAQFTVAAPSAEGEGEAAIEGEGETVQEGEVLPEGEIVLEGEIEGETLSEGEITNDGEAPQEGETNQEGEGEAGGPFNCKCRPANKRWPNWHDYIGDLMLLGLGAAVLLQWNRGK